jgi:DNA repair protein RecN (Recombination protein N)
MLKYLRVHNFTLLRDLSLDFSPGLTAITGETGAGKTILVSSLGALLGGRVVPDSAAPGDDPTWVEGVFDVSHRADLAPLLAERGWETEQGDLILRRELPSGGRGRAFIGSRTVSLGDLRAMGELLADLHGQHEHQALLRPSEHLPILDRFAGCEEERSGLAAIAAEIRRLRARLEEVARDQGEIARRIEILRFQVEEIDRAGVRPGETADLRRERERVRNAARIRELAAAALDRLEEGEAAAAGELRRALGAARELARLDPSVAGAVERAADTIAVLEELAEALRESAGGSEGGAERLEAIETRLALLESLFRKYGAGEETVLAFRDSAARELEETGSPEQSERTLGARLRASAERFAGIARSLSQRRREAAGSLATEVHRELTDLAMEGTGFEVEFRHDEDPASPVLAGGTRVAFDSSGWDRVQFLLRANPGEPFRPLSRTASGGELSRIALAIHVALSGADDGRLRVFDEADAGIGGRVAEAVGRKLRRLARGGQVLCVTHHPQIASQADHHLRITKRIREGRTEVRAEPLDRKGAIREVARMLGGARISEVTLRHAEEMVARGR